MADKYAHKVNLSPRERALNVLGCRMDWSLAEKCVDDLERAGLPSTDRVQAIAILHGHMSRARAVACANDLATYGGLVPAEERASR
jgi:hypothetical protein